MPTKTEGMISVPGGRVWYCIMGANSPGIPLLVLHGGPGAPHDYLENLALLADERPVIFYDQLGCGRSDRPDDPSLWRVERFVAELAKVRQVLGLERINLLGHSWGAMLALAHLLGGASGIERLVLSGALVSSSLWMRDQHSLLEDMPAEVRGAVSMAEEQGDFDSPSYQAAMLTYYERHLCRLAPWPECLQRTFAAMGMQVYLTMWGPSEFTCNGSLKSADLAPRLAEIVIPVLFTCGRHDEARPETVAHFSEQVPNARLEIFENASHSHHLEQPDQYLAVVRNFIRACFLL